MNRWDLPLLLCLAAGAALVLAELPWFRQGSLVARVRPYGPSGSRPERASLKSSASSVRAVFEPLIQKVGDRLSRVLGVTDDVATRLERANLPTDSSSFRLRQALHAALGVGIGALIALAMSPGPLLAVALVLALPLGWVFVDEQILTAKVADRRRRLQLELPVVAEQLGILLSGGYSLPASLSRLARRGSGVAADDLQRVTRRIRGGLSETEALREWAELSDSDPVRRLVAVLSLHREASDLGSLISEEARSIRAEEHRNLVETIERRSQLVWVPVTVATLVPGLLLLAVPFTSALSRVTGGP